MTSRVQSLLIRADASPAIGSGHIMRCLALAKAWQGSGGTVSCMMGESMPALEDRLIREKVTLNKVAAAPGTTNDAGVVVAEARRAKPDWLVVDGYRFGPDYIRKLKDAGLRILFLDDDARFDFYASDVVLNQNISACDAIYNNREPFTQLLLGSQYVLLRPEFLAESEAREHPAIGRKILVTTGGGDPENVTKKVLLALSRVKKDLEIRVIIGSGNSQDQVQDLAKQLSLKIKIEQNPDNMARLMRWADVAISGAGGTCWELAYMGLPSIVIALCQDQLGIAQGLADSNIAISLGWHASLLEEQISEALTRLLDDRQLRVAMSERGRNLIDGQGATRVVTFLRNFL